MNLRTLPLPALAAGAVLACLLAGPPAALAGTPSTVSVRVEGVTETKLPATAVTTSEAPVVKDANPAHACPGTTAVGALELATAGNWSGPWNASFNQYEIYSVLGETHVFDATSNANYFWSLWVDDHESEVGACEAQLSAGDRVLFFPSCFGSECPPEALPLEVDAAGSANAGEPVTFTVRRYNRTGEGTPLAGASVSGGGASATTDAGGHAQLSFARAGLTTVAVSAPASVRTETSVCVHAGDDGSCGTSTLPGSGTAPFVAQQSAYKGPFAVVAGVRGMSEHHVYSRRSAPRLLRGTAAAHTAVSSVSLRLRRRWHGRCFAYDGVRERFGRARCGVEAAYFKVAGGASFSYLLPSALKPGRYVLDVSAVDAAGNHTQLARGSTRTVFFVR
jgi:hypothetical protein